MTQNTDVHMLLAYRLYMVCGTFTQPYRQQANPCWIDKFSLLPCRTHVQHTSVWPLTLPTASTQLYYNNTAHNRVAGQLSFLGCWGEVDQTCAWMNSISYFASATICWLKVCITDGDTRPHYGILASSMMPLGECHEETAWSSLSLWRVERCLLLVCPGGPLSSTLIVIILCSTVVTQHYLAGHRGATWSTICNEKHWK